MNFQKLEKNIIDIIQEEQIKLGYRRESIRLYYPLLSLNRLLETDCGPDQMCEVLGAFSRHTEMRLGRIEFSHQKDRFCLTIPPQGSEYVHQNAGDNDFIRDFITTISQHGVTIDQMLQLFYKYSDNVHVEKLENEDFDYLVYFEDGIPDDFKYCLTDEGCHIIYHRFTVDDYNDFH